MTFYDLGLIDEILDGLDAMGFETPTPIQEQAIPEILAGKDMLACAQTGTGKTAAFLLPVLDLLTGSESTSIDCLILVPTRELAVQIDQQVMGLSYFCNVSSIAIYGGRDGKSFAQERKALEKGANIIVATPGRLIAHLQMKYVKTEKLNFLVMDEADRMLDMGFISDIKNIISYLPEKRQNLMFSATMAPEIRKFSKTILKDPFSINLAVAKPAEGILQAVYEVNDEVKLKLLRHLLWTQKEKTILIFSSTKANCKNIAGELKRAGLKIEEIHSDASQDEREQVLRDYKSGALKVLVATDILSRGIDVKGIDVVVNYDVPREPADYIHRIGRTGRAEAKGIAITFVNGRDVRKFQAIEKLMEQQVRRSSIPEELGGNQPLRKDDYNRGGRGGGRGRGGNSRGGSGGRNRNSGGGNRGRGGNRNSGGGGGNRNSGGGNRGGGGRR